MVVLIPEDGDRCHKTGKINFGKRSVAMKVRENFLTFKYICDIRYDQVCFKNFYSLPAYSGACGGAVG
jgi:hypothetical protein